MTRVRIDPAGWPFIAGALGLAIASGIMFGRIFAIPALVLVAVFVFFFRDPDRQTQATFETVVSPADGRVMIAGAAVPDAAPPGAWLQVSIFLSPMDVHVNRVPAAGRVTKVSYTPGSFLPAYRREAGAVNERSEIWIDHAGQMVVARQIVGVLARRVVCRLQPGTEVRAGDRYGVMKFGSRMDVFVPIDADLKVKAGDIVRGGETVIAVLH